MPAKPKPKVKAGHSKEAAAHKRRLFVEAYMANGQNATKAAAAAGYSGSALADCGYKMVHEPDVVQMIAERSRRVAELAEMKTESWAREVTRLAFSSIGDLVGPDGALIPIHELPPEVQAAIASVEVAADGTLKYKFWDKNAALATMARHLGLFEKDNQQQRPVLVRVELVG